MSLTHGFKRLYSTASSANKYTKLAQLLNEEMKKPIVQSKTSTTKETANPKKPNVQNIDASDITKQFAKLSPIPMTWKLGMKERSGLGKLLTNAKIKHEMSIYDYSKLSDSDDHIPEIMFLGRCNVGKSSLINSILSKDNQKTVDYFARVKSQAGYTPCLNFYNLGGALRIVDTPGYGIKGKKWQGELICEYLEKRNNLMNTYVLIDANVGVTEHDIEVLNMLQGMGIKYDVVLNKIDKIANSKRMETVLSVGKEVKEIGDGLWRCTFAVAGAARDGVGCLLWNVWDVCGKPPVHQLKKFEAATVVRERVKREKRERRAVKRIEREERQKGRENSK